MRKVFSLLLVAALSLPSAFAQTEPAYIAGEVLVRLPDGKGIESVVRDLQTIGGKPSGLRVGKQLSRHLNIWRLEFDAQSFSHQAMLESLWGHPLVRTAQNNHYIHKRVTTPNDPSYNLQWQYDNTGANGGTPDADIDAPEAWDITTGGVTALGDTIVVCVVDDGLDLSHQDFGGNLWVNYAEIPNNNIDDDNNGYVDDHRGWNIDNDDDDISGGFFGGGHGSCVAGIVGARGNNGIGVAGVNWQVKLMIVVGGGNEAQAIESYEYALAQRVRYNQTNGNEGAFVVATNSSWGVDNLQWTNAPLWCAFYDTLGVHGIISAGATTNNESNVDVTGDMPTSCPSEYLISVTNLERTGNKSTAGYGTTTVDLGAFGASAYTVADNNSYAPFGGTSGATPHVAGAIALLYSAPCPAFAALAKADPEAAGLRVRDAILSSVVPNPDLVGITTTEGTLNLKNALDVLLASGCNLSGCYEPFGLTAYNLQGTSAQVRWWGVPVSSSYDVRYREQGTSNWTTVNSVDSFVTINGLTACTDYEVQILADCDTAQSNYSNLLVFRTGDCCLAPTTINTTDIQNTAASFSWNSDAFVNSYTIEYKDANASTWTTVTSNTASIALSNLLPCTNYELRILSSCAINVNNEYSAVISFKTKGCGACEDATYCASAGGDATYEWIGNVSLGTLDNTTQSDGGYGNYTGSNTPDLMRGAKHYLSLTVDRASPSTVNWRVWMDFDQDGVFEATEKVYEQLNFSGVTTGDSIDIPVTALEGITRMRVSMRYNSAATECQNFAYGEVEDYCVNIQALIGGVADSGAPRVTSSVQPNPFERELWVYLHNLQTEEVLVRLTNLAGQTLQTQSVSASAGVSQLSLETADLPSGLYFVHLRWASGETMVHKVVKR